MNYQATASRYVRGMYVVADVTGSPTSATAKLCEAFSGNRFSYREHGFLMSGATFRNFVKAARLGCRSHDGAVVEWGSQDGERVRVFDPKHPARALSEIARRP